MTKSYAPRIASTVIAGSLALASLGCNTSMSFVYPKQAKPTLPNNVVNNYNLGEINSNEENFSIPRISLCGEDYYVMPLSGPKGEELANPTLPSVYLIPSNQVKSRITLSQVGVPGGKASIDSPGGFTFMPYSVEFDTATTSGKALLKPRDPKNDNGLSRIVIPSITFPDFRPNSSQSGISLESITNKDLPFATQTFSAGSNSSTYVVIPMNKDKQDFASNLPKNDVLSMFFLDVDSKNGFDIERGGSTDHPEHPRIWGKFIVFVKKSLNDYVNERGLKQVSKPQVSVPPAATGAPNQNKP